MIKSGEEHWGVHYLYLGDLQRVYCAEETHPHEGPCHWDQDAPEYLNRVRIEWEKR